MLKKTNRKIKVFELTTVDITLYKFILPLMERLKENDFEVICGSKKMNYLDKIEEKQIKTYDIALERNLNPLSLIKSTVQLIKIFKKEKINILHVHTPIASIVGRLAAFFTKVDVKIYTVHGFILEPKIFYYIEKIFAKLFTDFIFTVNDEDLNTAISKNFISEENAINLNSIGIDVDKFNPKNFSDRNKQILKDQLNIKNDEKIIGYVGRIVKSKGVLDLVKAFITIQGDYNCKLLLIGPWALDERDNDKIIDKIRNLIKEHQLENKIILLGNRKDIPALLSIIDIFVLPSYREGMPISLLEAMAMEKSVIGTNIRGIKDEITNDTGLIYEKRDISKLSEHIKFYLENEEVALNYGKNARKRVKKYFNQKKIIEKQIKVFKEYRKQLYLKKD